MLGALCHYIASADAKGYQPTNASFGLLPPPPPGARGRKDRRLARANRALKSLEGWIASCGEGTTVESAP